MMMIRFSDDQAVEGGIHLVVALGQAVVDCERDQGFVDGLDEGLTSWFLDPFLVCIRARICCSHPKAIKTHMLSISKQSRPTCLDWNCKLVRVYLTPKHTSHARIPQTKHLGTARSLMVFGHGCNHDATAPCQDAHGRSSAIRNRLAGGLKQVRVLPPLRRRFGMRIFRSIGGMNFIERQNQNQNQSQNQNPRMAKPRPHVGLTAVSPTSTKALGYALRSKCCSPRTGPS